MGPSKSGEQNCFQRCALSEIDHNSAVKRITEALKGPVADVYRELIPAFREFKGDAFYDAVLASPDMLHGCLLIFRKRREAFDHLLVDDKGRLVNDDFVRLRCGRSVHDIIAMIVRTHAKRQFRQSLGGDPNDAASKAGRLYAAMNEYLIHEWQVPLVAHYAPMPAAKMRELGPALLDLKTADEVDAAVVAAGGTPITNSKGTNGKATVKALAPPAPEPILVENNSREHDFWWETLNDPQVRNALGPLSDNDKRELTAAFCSISEATRTTLLGGFSLSLFQGAVLMTKCYQGLGRASFAQVFGKPGSPDTVKAFAERLKTRNVTSRMDLNSLARTVEANVSAMGRPNTRAAANANAARIAAQ